MLFLREVLTEVGTWCCISTTRDYKYISSRVEHEGLSFLTIALPDFGKDLEKGLEQGHLDSSLFCGFRKKGVMPLFLGGMLSLVFNSIDGVLLDEPSVVAIRGIRQLTLMFSKIGIECSDERKDAAIAKYIQCEQDVKESDRNLSPADLSAFERVGQLLFRELFSTIDSSVYYGKILPKHGPGSTADGLLGNKKYRQLEWTSRLEAVFPFGEVVAPNWRSYMEIMPSLNILEPGAERPVKVITVPKTLKTPRIIAKEPTCMQYMQQGILEAITEGIEESDFLSRLISTKSQEPNRRLALRGSLSGELATLDLSEASDRVSNQHVRALLRFHPHLRAAVDATRSRKADVDGYGVIRLAKFASMGSALCFPFESMVFLTLLFVGVERELNTPLTIATVKSLLGKVRVYGDDIIVPTHFALSVMKSLESFGIKVNKRKSFWNGKFRESCGAEYYNGTDVSIVRVRAMLPASRKDTTEIISTVSLRNQLSDQGFDRSVQFLDSLLEKVIPFPYVGRESPILGRWSPSGLHQVDRWDPEMQRPLVKGVVVSSKLPDNSLDGWPALMKWFLKRGDLPFADRNHLQYSGRPVSVDIKTRWRSAV